MKMGGGLDRKTGTFDCNQQQVTAKLDQVFKNPGTAKYQYAQAHNIFNTVPNNAAGNWNDLFNAYTFAGVDVGSETTAWKDYLSVLGAGASGTSGPQTISQIAQTRYDALIQNQGITTKTHGNGGPVHFSQGVIDSPCPP
jgi:hypothetical protein